MEKIVLVVEADEALRDTLCAVLRAEGYDARGVASGEEAVAAARLWHPSAIVIDGDLPALAAQALLGTLDGDPDLAQIPRYVMFASNSEESAPTKSTGRMTEEELGYALHAGKPGDRYLLN